MRKINDIIEVEEIMDVIEEGTTVPVRCRLENGMNVVVKYMKNPYGQQVLVNEYIGSNIADMLGLTIPEYGVCNLSKEVIVNTNQNEDIDERNSGLAFYTKDHTKTVPPNHTILSLVKNKEVEKLMLFDHIVNNCDRHEGNLLIEITREAKLYVIDNSHIVTKQIGKEKELFELELEDSSIFSRNILIKNQQIYDLLCSALGYNEDLLFEEAEKVKNSITEKFLSEIIENIPMVWIESVGKEIVDNIFKIINKRVSYICEIAQIIAEERRKK